MKRGAISIICLKRWFIYRPLAAILAVMMVPIFARFEGDAGVRASQASAASLGTSTSIIQNCGIGPICSDLRQLESDAVNAYLGLHHLPPGDAHIIYDYGRTDLRSAIRGAMVNIMGDIIAEQASQRDRHERNLYDWLQSLVQQNEIAEYKLALDQFRRWQADPCTFVLDPDIARQYGLTYNPLPFCFPSPLAPARQIPDAGYFKLFGFKNSYAKPASTFPYFASLVRDTAVNAAAVWGITAGIYAVVATGVAVALAKSFAAVLALVTAGTPVVAASKGAALVLSSGAVAGLGGAAIIGGVVAIILIAVAIGVTVGIQAFTTQGAIDELNGLNGTLTQVTNTPPDLSAFATDSSGLGPYKLQATINGQTLPEVPSTDVLPVHSDSDLNFAIQKSNETRTSVSSTLAYQDWFAINWSAQTYGGWFVQTCNSGSKCTQADSINANLRYVDWSGVNWTAMRVEDKFISVKNTPAPTDKVCDPDPTTGVSTGPDFSKCKSYYSTTIPLKAPGGVLERVSMSVLPPTAPPVFTSGTTVPFTPGVPSRQTITASGTPSPQICVFSSDPPLPPEFSLVGGVCGNNGRLQLAFNGNPDSPQQDYELTLSAANGTTDGPVLQTFIIDVSRHLGITSPGVLDGTAGLPVNFLVTTTGFPPPRLSLDAELLAAFPGLTFTDNGNGTGTIGGTSTVFGTRGCLLLNGKAGCGVVASNSQGTIIQGFIINLAPAPPASLGPLTEATFVAGADNTVVVTSTGAKTRVGWRVMSKPPWTNYDDNENGTLTLSGMPPAGTSGTFSVLLTPVAEGSTQLAKPPPPSTYLLKVVNTPLFLSPNTTRFTVGVAGSFAISANEGNIDLLVGPKPKGLSFTGGNPASITGTPTAGSGGQYQVALRDVVGNQVSVYQSLVLNVDEAPTITSLNKATFPTGFPGLFTVTTTGFPSVSGQPLAPPLTAPTSPNQGKGMYFTVTGLPAGFTASNLDPQGFATGTLTIQGTPLLGDAGRRSVQITARNGVGATAQQTLTLNIVKLMGLVPASGNACDGAYIGVFDGDIAVTPDQNCMFVGGGVRGQVTVLGGDFTLSGANVTGKVMITGSSRFSISGNSVINGVLNINNVGSEVFSNPLCGSRVTDNLLVYDNSVPIEIGSPQTCPGNVVGQLAVIMNNRGPIRVYNNQIAKTLNCSGNLSIAGGGNSALHKLEQCAAF